MENPKFLKKTYGDLHTSPEVVSAKERTEKREKTNIGTKPEDLIQNYLNRFNEILEREDTEEREQGIEALKKILHKNLIIKNEDIPYRAFELEQDIAEQGGHGRPEITERFKQEKTRQIQEDQRASLDTWINYLSSPDAMYPDWAKYWAFRSITQMGGYNKKDKKFGKRTIDTVHAFPTLNAGCLAEVVGAMEKRQKEESLDDIDPKFKELLSTENFSKLYTYALEEFGGLSWENLENIRGFWKKYKQGSEPDELVESLKGFPLEWCTRNETTARNQLKGGDFYTYYSEDNSGVARVPRLAIRMNGVQEIGEIRGIEENQNIDQYIQPVLDEKLKEFGNEGDRYIKKSNDMKKMTSVAKKYRSGQELDGEDLRFLYEIDEKIEGFGYEEDPRVEEVRSGREKTRVKVNDYAKIYNCKPSQISTTEEELTGDTVFHLGDLNLDGLTTAKWIKLPNFIEGDLYLRNLTTAEGLELPDRVGGDFYLNRLTNAEGLDLPDRVGGDLYLNNLTTAERLELPDIVGGSIDLQSLTTVEKLEFPYSVGGSIDLQSLTTVEELEFPDSVEGDLNLNSLTTARGLKLPGFIEGFLDLRSLTTAEGLELPVSVDGDLCLNSLTTAEGLELPVNVDGDLCLNNLTTAKNLKFSHYVRRSIDLRSLTTAEGLELPGIVGGHLNLDSLTTAEGLELPHNVWGHLNLDSLTTAEGLELPGSVGGHLYLNSLTTAEGLELPDNIKGVLYVNGLPDSEKLKLLEKYPQYKYKIYSKHFL